MRRFNIKQGLLLVFPTARGPEEHGYGPEDDITLETDGTRVWAVSRYPSIVSVSEIETWLAKGTLEEIS